jgi:hypothetical protein
VPLAFGTRAALAEKVGHTRIPKLPSIRSSNSILGESTPMSKPGKYGLSRATPPEESPAALAQSQLRKI